MKRIKQMFNGEERHDHDSKVKESIQINKNIVQYLMKNVYLQNKIEFYANLDLKIIQNLVTAAFKQGNIGQQSKIFVINLLKKHAFILNIALTDQKFDYTNLFSFLHSQTVSYELLNALEEILLPFCKKFPQKVSQFVNEEYKYQIDFFEQYLYQTNIQTSLYSCLLLLATLFQINLRNIELNYEKFDQFHFRIQPSPFKQTIDIKNGLIWTNFLSDLTVNLASVQLTLVQRFISFINGEIIIKMVHTFTQLRENYECQDYCQGIIIIFINLLKLLQTFKLSVNCKSHEKDKTIKVKVQSMLCLNAVSISSFLPSYIQFLVQKNKKNLNYSSGEMIERVGLIKYRLLELIQKIFSINQIENLKIQFDKFDFFLVIIVFLDRYKWNSIAHNLIVKITQHLISQDYQNFKNRYIQNIGNPNKSLFGQLIIQFRNRKFIFLHSMRMINQAHRSLIFRISQIIILQMQERNDLNKLIEIFKIWKQYMQIDLIDYEQKNYEMSLCYNGEKGEPPKITNKKYNDTNTPVSDRNSTRPLQTFEQILINFKQEQKWSPKQVPNKLNKEHLMNNQQIKRMDSLAQYHLPTS